MDISCNVSINPSHNYCKLQDNIGLGEPLR